MKRDPGGQYGAAKSARPRGAKALTWPGFMLKLRPDAHQRGPYAGADQARGEEIVHRLRHGGRGCACQSAEVRCLRSRRVGHVAEFDQHRGHVGRFQHLEAGRLDRMLVQRRDPLDLAHHHLRELQRKGLGLALGEVDQDIGDVIRLGRKIDAGDHVGPVFGLGQPRGFRVGGVFRQRVDAGALRLALAARHRVGMDRDEQRGLELAREAHALGERDEGVVVARHRHPVFAAALEQFAQLEPEGEHDVLLLLAVEALGAGVDAAMAGIDHDQRTRIGARLRGGLVANGGVARPARGQRDVAQEARAVGRGQIEHQPRRLSVDRGKREGLLDPHRPGDVEHDARAALHDQAVAEGLDQAAALLAGMRRQLEGDLRQVDHDSIGIGEREAGDIDLAREVDHETGLFGVAAERARRSPPASIPPARRAFARRCPAPRPKPADRARRFPGRWRGRAGGTARFRPFPALSTPIRRFQLTELELCKPFAARVWPACTDALPSST